MLYAMLSWNPTLGTLLQPEEGLRLPKAISQTRKDIALGT